MKTKFNPNQLVLDLFPVESVAKVNEAHIIDFKRAYWAYSEIGLEYRDNMSDEFIKRLARDAAESKTGLREMMRRSRKWREALQAWVIPISHTVKTTTDEVLSMIWQMWNDARPTDNYTWRDMSAATTYFIPGGDNEESARAIEKITGRLPRRGMKKSKLFAQVSKALGVYTTERGSRYQKLEAQLFTTLAAPFKDDAFHREEKDTLYVSINPAHFLSMSNPKGDSRGVLMVSCHSFNGHYEYKSGCIGYARDTVSLLAFTAAKGVDALLNRKTSRQVFFYQDGALIQSRLYSSKTGTDYGGVHEAGGQWEYATFRNAIQKEIVRCDGGRSDWTTVDYRQKIHLDGAKFDEDEDYDDDDDFDNTHNLKLNRYGVQVFAGEDFGGYRDWEQFANRKGMIRVSVRKSRLGGGRWLGRYPIFAGEAGLNIQTGEEIYRDEEIIA